MAGALDGKVAAITGGAAGMGLATARLFLEQGAKVVIGDLQEGEVAALQARFGDAVAWLRTDVLFEADVEALVACAVDSFGGLDILFNNAGYGGTIAELDQLKMESVERTIGVLLTGVIHGYKHGVAAMKARGGGSIISTASVAGLVGGGGPVIYSVCKAGVVHLAKCAAIELAPHRIRSNAICPGAIRTQLLSRAYGVSKEEAEPFRAFLAARAEAGEPIPRIGEPDDIAQTALFLASPASKFITGQAIAVDGGYVADPAADLGQRAALIAALKDFRARA
jgi:NAD(P)-dependent dehydrogenase (short-subunit alcohol dehydrogenase family)